MNIEIVQFGTETRMDLCSGTYVVGGAKNDDIRVPGLPPSLLELRIDESQLRVVARQTLSIDQVFVPAGAPRLLLPGEQVQLSEGVVLRLAASTPPREVPGTVALLRQMLEGAAQPAPAGKAASLTCLTGMDSGRCYPLSDTRAEIGRGEGVQIRVRDRAVSRRHAAVRQENGTFVLEDLGAPNGLYVNGLRVMRPTRLHDGAIIELGRSLLRFQAAVQEPASSPPPTPAALPEREPHTRAPLALVSPHPDEAELAESDPLHELPRPRWHVRSSELAFLAAGGALAAAGCLVAFALV